MTQSPLSESSEERRFVPPTTQLRAAPPAETSMSGPEWKQMLRAFRHYNFRLYFVGMLVSVIGTWAQIIAQSWLVLELTNSPLILGQVTAVMAIPVWLLSPWAGVVIDRTPRRTLLLITQIIQMIQAFALAALTFSGRIEVWHIFWLSGLRGLANSFDAPTRHAFVVEMVGKEDLSNGIALNSTLFSLARVLGPSIGGIILALIGTAWAFTINGLTFLAIIVALLLIKVDKPVLKQRQNNPLKEMAEGLRYIWGKKEVFALMMVVLAIALFGSNFNTLLPVVVRDVFGKDELAYGTMSTFLGIGSIIGTLLVTYLSNHPGRGHRLIQMNLIFPLTLVAFALSPWYPLSLVLLILVGASFIPQLSLSNILIQSNIPDEIRGRVMSIYTLMVFGAFPLGAWIAGGIAEVIGAPAAILISAGVVLVTMQAVRYFTPGLVQLD